MRAGYERPAGWPDVLRRTGELSARTAIVDIEPLVAHWDSGQEALDRGIASVFGQIAAIPGVRVVCFATNSARRPSVLPRQPGVRALYLSAAGKPLRIRAYRDLPRPGVVVGDQIATDGILARRLGYAFLHYWPALDRVPPGPRLMSACGRLIRPLLFAPPPS